MEITKANHNADLFEDAYHGPGQPHNPHVQYLPTHPKFKTVHQVICSLGHHNLPNFLSKWFPQNDDKAIYNFYCACMLTLLKLWQKLKEDLKSPTESWVAAFGAFSASATPRV